MQNSMSDSDLVRFHLAYVPAAITADGKTAATNKSTNTAGENYGNPPIAVRRASAIRLYRCRIHHARNDGNDEHIKHCTDKSSGNSSTDNSGHRSQSEEGCQCCCCLAGVLMSDFPQQMHPSAGPITPSGRLISSPRIGLEDKNNSDEVQSSSDTNLLLAVLVPSSLTQQLVNVIDGTNNNHFVEKGHSNDIFVTEEELRKSIHPCLSTQNDKATETSSDGLNHNEEQRGADQQHYPTQRNSTMAPDSPQLLVCGIITSNNVSNTSNFPADVVLLTPKAMHPNTYLGRFSDSHLVDRSSIISHYSQLLNHETASSAPWCAIKAFPVNTLSVLPLASPDTAGTLAETPSETFAKEFDIAGLPCCPVCLNLIEPTRLGLPELKPRHKCSRWCSGSTIMQYECPDQHPCVNEIKFLPWPPPASCIACQRRGLPVENGPQKHMTSVDTTLLTPPTARTTIQTNHPDQTGNISAPSSLSATQQVSHRHTLTCHQCEMSTTLWVCLTCGVVGCGRYTLKHAAQHYTSEGHPYSLELATGRIWDYSNGIFVHRRDLAECPVLSTKWGIAIAGGEGSSSVSPFSTSSPLGSSFQERGGSHSFSENDHHSPQRKQNESGLIHNMSNGLEDSTTCNTSHNEFVSLDTSKPKKSMMISQEYEALLQSALEDQSQHFEGEISRLRADLASSRMQHGQISDREKREILFLQKDSERLKRDVEKLSSALLDVQTKEAKHRSMSQRLLREQSISKDLLEKIRQETLSEHESGKQRMEDLELQITDLTANLRMMSQFANNEELSQAQIFGTIGGEKGGKQRGKKARKGRRKG
ncbi:hypothetical protein ACHAWF_009729 [Thalassiosira exigua]